MLKLNFFHLCEYASILRNGTPLIAGIFSNIRCSSFPFRKNFYLVLDFTIKDKKGSLISLEIQSPSGKKVLSGFKRTIPEEKVSKSEKYGMIIEIPGVKIAEEGDFKIKVFSNKDLLKKIKFNVTKK